MHCFVHRDSEAIGICKCCAKGVCDTCAIPVANGLACSAGCAPIAESLSQLQLAAIRNAGVYRAQRVVQPLAAIGLVAIGVSVLYSPVPGYMGWIMVAMGGLIGLSLLVSAKRKQ